MRPFLTEQNGVWWLATKYSADGSGTITITERWDLSEQMNEIIKHAIIASNMPGGRMN